jgi:hypothetical protein
MLLFEAGREPLSLLRMLQADQENRAMHEEQSRLLGNQ